MPKPILHTALFYLPHHLSSVLVHADGNIHMAGAHHGGHLLINSYSRIHAVRLWFAGINFKIKMLVAVAAVVIPASILLTLFALPKQVPYAYAGKNCFSNIVVLPGFVSARANSGYAVNMEPTLSIGGYPLFSNTSCIALRERPTADTTQTVTMQVGFIKKTISVLSGSLPSVTATSNLSEPMSPVEGVAFTLSQPDETFNYTIQSGENAHDCNKDDISLTCPLADFNFSQGQEHEIAVLQYFGGSGEQIFSGSVKLRDPVVITSASVGEGQIIYDSPQSISITTNKPIEAAGTVELFADTVTLGVQTQVTETGFDVVFDEPLPRQTELVLSVSKTVASDGAYLPEPYTLRFSTSGGPKVAGINISSYDVGLNTPVVLTFDYNLDSTQNISQFIRLRVGNEYIAIPITVSGNRVTITKNLSMCTPFTVEVIDGITNSAGITGGSAWSMNSRTTCRQTYSIGTSVQGRSLIAHRFGSGPTTILFVGGMHGNEQSSYYTLNAFVDELEKNYDRIPTGKTIIVIPDINPDGFAARIRTNANGVDLNRNFPSNDWISAVYMPGNIYLEQGGGAAPLDQPESAALAALINQTNPRVVLTYHAVARAVIANGAGDSIALSQLYANASGYAQYDSGHEDSIFNYATTGEFETWLADKKGIPALLVELATLSRNEMYSQRDAMWSMLSL